MRSAAVQYARTLLSGNPADKSGASPPAHSVWRVDPSSFIANGEKLIRSATDIGARPIWVTSPIAWPPPGQSDTSGTFHYHHRYHRAGRYAAKLAGSEIAELANNFNLYRNFFENPAADIQHFNAAGHNFAGDYLARFILGLPLRIDVPSRSSPDESADQ